MKKRFCFVVFLFSLTVSFAEEMYLYECNIDTKGVDVMDASENILISIPNEEIDYFGPMQIVGNKFYYLSETNTLMVLDIEKKSASKTKITNIANFRIADDGKTICVGAKKDFLNNSKYTLVPELYDLKKQKILKCKTISFDFLKSVIGYVTHIEYDSEGNFFEVSYNCDSFVPVFFVKIYLENYQYEQVPYEVFSPEYIKRQEAFDIGNNRD